MNKTFIALSTLLKKPNLLCSLCHPAVIFTIFRAENYGKSRSYTSVAESNSRLAAGIKW
ncbi:hypothetical protein SAMN05444412_105123 [Rhodonellum ikkaensis]|uniref:Uncharacterized protein n=1 Tax=Rhodonellum ikkaensis TaxID=336829 RepID=A0A1H3Q0H2_9BACT|nr:hypothetical protein SAMN05444412_105123 [Rhodonellum ikkaensis]